MEWILYRYFLKATRYPLYTLNLYIYPFFMIFPYVLISEYFSISDFVFKNMIAWVWLSQILFGVSNSIVDFKIEGDFSVVLMLPIRFHVYLFVRYIYIVMDCLIITFVSLVLGYFLLDLSISNLLFFLLNLLLLSLSIFCVSLVLCSLVLRFKKVASINVFIQQFLGAMSGYTNSIKNYPYYIKFISLLIPLTYTIFFHERNVFHGKFFIAFVILSISYYLLGRYLMKKSLVFVKRKGDVDLW